MDKKQLKGDATSKDSNISNTGTDTSVEEEKEVKPTSERLSSQYKYLKYYERGKEEGWDKKELRTFIESVEEKDPFIYEWNDNHWEKAVWDDLVTNAQKFLRQFDKKNFGRGTAESCINTLKGELKKFKIFDNVKKKETIIPLRNKWLYIDEKDGDVKFVIKDPNKEVPIKYVIDTDIAIPDEGELYIPKKVPVDSKFHKYIVDTLPDEEIRGVLQEYLGYTFLNHCRYEKALVMEGEGSNGKSVLIDLIKALHKKTANLQLGNMGGNGSLAEIIDASLLFSTEMPKHVVEEILKQIISGEGIAVKMMKKNMITVYTTAKLIVACNTFPMLGDKSNGVYRRLIIVPFNNRMEETDPRYNPKLASQIIENELHIFLDWCLIGLERLLRRNRFAIPEKLNKITEEKMRLNNNVRQYFSEVEYVIDTKQFPTPKDTVFADYQEWCITNGFKPMNSTNFFIELNRVFNKQVQTARLQEEGVRKYFCNLILKEKLELREQKVKEELARQEDPFADNYKDKDTI